MICEKCGAEIVSAIREDEQFHCPSCRQYISPFPDTHIPIVHNGHNEFIPFPPVDPDKQKHYEKWQHAIKRKINKLIKKREGMNHK